MTKILTKNEELEINIFKELKNIRDNLPRRRFFRMLAMYKMHKNLTILDKLFELTYITKY